MFEWCPWYDHRPGHVPFGYQGISGCHRCQGVGEVLPVVLGVVLRDLLGGDIQAGDEEVQGAQDDAGLEWCVFDPESAWYGRKGVVVLLGVADCVALRVLHLQLVGQDDRRHLGVVVLRVGLL